MADDPHDQRDDKGRFIAGNSGNGGRKKGARSKLGEAFLANLHNDWEKHGVSVIERVRDERPHEYLKVVASLLPKEFDLGDETANALVEVIFRRAS